MTIFQIFLILHNHEKLKKERKSYLCNDEVTLQRQRDVFQEIHAAERPPASVVAAVVVAAAVAAVRMFAGYSASASAFESLAARVCDDDAGADTTPVSNTPASSPLVHKEAHKEENALLSLRPAIKRERVFLFDNYCSYSTAIYRLTPYSYIVHRKVK